MLSLGDLLRYFYKTRRRISIEIEKNMYKKGHPEI